MLHGTIYEGKKPKTKKKNKKQNKTKQKKEKKNGHYFTLFIKKNHGTTSIHRNLGSVSTLTK
jgi:hypothetical protein